MANVPLKPPITPLDRQIRGLLAQLGHLLRERAHAQVIVTVREGKIQLVNVNRSYLPENIPET